MKITTRMIHTLAIQRMTTLSKVPADLFEQDFALDLKLVYAGYVSKFNGAVMCELAGTSSPLEALMRTDWLRLQPQEYIDRLVAGAAALIETYKPRI